MFKQKDIMGRDITGSFRGLVFGVRSLKLHLVNIYYVTLDKSFNFSGPLHFHSQNNGTYNTCLFPSCHILTPHTITTTTATHYNTTYATNQSLPWAQTLWFAFYAL